MWANPYTRPAHADIITLQLRAKRFWSFLHRSLAPATIATYWSAVIASHRDWLQGTSLRELGIVFPAVKDHVSVFRLREPPREQKENLWNLQHTLDLLDTSPELQHWIAPAHNDEAFQQRSAFAVINTLWSQLLRASEILPSSGAQARASTALWNLSDLSFHTKDGMTLPILPSGSPDISRAHELAYTKIRMVPSKADKHATNMPLLFPMSFSGLPRAMSPCAYFWDLCVKHPVNKALHPSTPLFSSSISSRSERLSENQFMKQWKGLCTTAGITFKRFGKHAFRRGGINRLIDLNCSAPQIAALGRWKSDVWKIYARRNKDQLMVITAAMSSPEPLLPTVTKALPGPLLLQGAGSTSPHPSATSQSTASLVPNVFGHSSSSLPAFYPASQHSYVTSTANESADLLSRSKAPVNDQISARKSSKKIPTKIYSGPPRSLAQKPPSADSLHRCPLGSSSLSSQEIRRLPPHVTLVNTPKSSSAPHINERCTKANGFSISQACSLRVSNRNRTLVKYSISDIKYDLAKGFLRLLSPSTLHTSSAPPPKRRRLR